MKRKREKEGKRGSEERCMLSLDPFIRTHSHEALTILIRSNLKIHDDLQEIWFMNGFRNLRAQLK